MKKYEKILILIVKSQRGGITQKEITEKIKVDSDHVRTVTKELEKEGLIYKRKIGRSIKYYPKEKLFAPSIIYKDAYRKLFHDVSNEIISPLLDEMDNNRIDTFINNFALNIGGLITYILLKSNDFRFTSRTVGKDDAFPEYRNFFILRTIEAISSQDLLLMFRDALQFLELTCMQKTFHTYQLNEDSVKELEDSFKKQFPHLHILIENALKELEEKYVEKVDEYVKHWCRHTYRKIEKEDTVKLECSNCNYNLEIERIKIEDDPKVIQYLQSKVSKCKEKDHLWQKPNAPFFYCYGYKCFYCQQTMKIYFFPFEKFRKVEDQIQHEKGKTEEGFDVFIKIYYELLNYFQIHRNEKIPFEEIERHIETILKNTFLFTEKDNRFYNFNDKVSYVIDLLIENDYIQKEEGDIFMRRWDYNFE